jgi:hypothetical protein
VIPGFQTIGKVFFNRLLHLWWSLTCVHDQCTNCTQPTQQTIPHQWIAASGTLYKTAIFVSNCKVHQSSFSEVPILLGNANFSSFSLLDWTAIFSSYAVSDINIITQFSGAPLQRSIYERWNLKVRHTDSILTLALVNLLFWISGVCLMLRSSQKA